MWPIAVALCLVPAVSQYAVAAEGWQLAAVATSDHVQRGISHSDGDPALQAGASYSFGSGVYAGVWSSTVSNARTSLRGVAGRLEVSYMAGYARPLGQDWDFDVALLRYEYPDSDAPVNYGYTELSGSVGYRDRLRATVAASRDATIYTSDGLQSNIRTYAWELVGLQPLGPRLTWLAGLGYLDLRDGAGTGYTYFNMGLAARLPRLDLELQYVDTLKAERLFGRRLAGPRVVLAMMVSFQ